MHLAIATHNLIRGDGQGRVNFEVAAHGLRHGHQVTLLADRVDSELLQLGATWLPVRPLMRRPILMKAVEFAASADRAIRRHRGRFDVIVGNGFSLQCRHTVNCAHFVHGAWLDSPQHPFRSRPGLYGAYHRFNSLVNARIEKHVFGASQRIVAVSGRVARELQQCGMTEKQIDVIHNGVDPHEFRPGQERRADLGLPDGPLALFVGDLKTPRKNLDSVLEALRSVEGLQLAVVGDAAESAYPKRCVEWGLAERVRFLGRRGDVASLMRSSDFLIAPSRYEPFGLIILEALASGIPVVTAATCGAAELVTRECGMVLEDPEDVPGLAEALSTMLSDARMRHQMGQAGREIALANTWEKMAQRYWTIFRSCS